MNKFFTSNIIGILLGVSLILSFGFMGGITLYYTFYVGQQTLTISRVMQEETNPKSGELIKFHVTYDKNKNVCNGRIPDLIEAEIKNADGIITKVVGYSKYKDTRGMSLGQQVYFYSWNDVILDYGKSSYFPEPIYAKVHDAWN